jgi:hypothetical protein
LGLGTALVFNLVGFGLPALRTYEMMDAKEDTKGALAYWVVFGLFAVVADLLDWLLCWIPFFFFARLAFQIWLFLGNFQGAQKVFAFVAPVLLSKLQEVHRTVSKPYAIAPSSPANKSS